jgi:hypothetical protein
MNGFRPAPIAAIFVFALGLAGAADAAETATPTAKLTREQFDRLPDSAILEIRGSKTTAGELRALGKRHAADVLAKGNEARARARGEADAFRAKFLAAEKTKLAEENARQRAEYSRAIPSSSVKPDPTKPILPAGGLQFPPEVVSAPGSVKPGSVLFIKGKHFGASAGRVLLKGLPGGDRQLGFDPTFLFPWMNDAIAVVVPGDISGIVDQPARVQVVTQTGKASNDWPVQFHATVDVAAFTGVVLVHCAKDATENRCEVDSWFFEGSHQEDTFYEEDALGCDKWKASVKLPWTLHHLDWGNASSPGNGSVGNPGQPAAGSTSWTFQFCWTVNGAGPYSGNTAHYLATLYAVGPHGVPW